MSLASMVCWSILSTHGVAVGLFQRLTESAPTHAVVDSALRDKASLGKESRLAEAYFRGMRHTSGRGFTRALSRSSASDYTEATLEAIPYAVRHFAVRGDLRPARVVSSWHWDGASAELIAETFLWCAVHREPFFVPMFTALAPESRRGVAQLVALESDRALASTRLATARRKKNGGGAAFWRAVLVYAE